MLLSERSARILFGVSVESAEIKYVRGQRGKAVTAWFLRANDAKHISYGRTLVPHKDVEIASDGFGSKTEALNWLDANNIRFLETELRRRQMEEYMVEIGYKMKLVPFKDKDTNEIKGFAFFDEKNVCFIDNRWRKIKDGKIAENGLFPNKKIALLAFTNRVNRKHLDDKFDPRTFTIFKEKGVE